VVVSPAAATRSGPTTEQIDLRRGADFDWVGTPERTRHHAKIEQFRTVEEPDDFLAAAGRDRRAATLVHLSHHLKHQLAVDFYRRMRQRRIRNARSARAPTAISADGGQYLIACLAIDKVVVFATQPVIPDPGRLRLAGIDVGVLMIRGEPVTSHQRPSLVCAPSWAPQCTHHLAFASATPPWQL
jgi:hypothetical protein